jgi:hypothetical protein
MVAQVLGKMINTYIQMCKKGGNECSLDLGIGSLNCSPNNELDFIQSTTDEQPMPKDRGLFAPNAS